MGRKYIEDRVMNSWRNDSNFQRLVKDYETKIGNRHWGWTQEHI